MQSTIASQASCSGRASSWLHNTSSAIPSNIMHRPSRCSLPSCFTRRTQYRTRHASPKASAAAKPGSSPSGLQVSSSVMDILCLLASVLLLGRSVQQYQRAHQAAVDTAQQGTKRQIAGLHHMQTASCQQQALLDPLLCIGPSACLCMLAISSMVFKASQSRSASGTSRLSMEAAARIAKLEAVTAKQLSEFEAASRQVEKLQTRTRLTSADLRRPLAEAQSTLVQHSAVLSKLIDENVALRGQLQDTQQLLLALQAASAKQFMVTVDAIKQLRAKAL